jgi:hypothetical protein
MLGRHRAAAAVLLNPDAAEHLMSHVHATVDEAEAHRADAVRIGRAWHAARRGRRRGLRSAHVSGPYRAAVGIDVIEVIDARRIEPLQAHQGACGTSRSVQHHDVRAEFGERVLAHYGKSRIAGRLQRGRARGQRQHLPAHDGRAVGVGLEHVTVPAQQLANPQGAQFPQAPRIDLARERGGGLVDIQRHACRGKIRQRDARHLGQTHGGQTDLRAGRRRDQQQACQCS